MWQRKSEPRLKRIDSLIGAGTTVDGDVTFTGGLRVDGEVKGNVIAAEGEASTLVISESARIDGAVRVAHVVVNGTVNGPITADAHVELQGKARVVGDLRYGTLEMHVGAIVQGRLNPAEHADMSVVELKRSGGA